MSNKKLETDTLLHLRQIAQRLEENYREIARDYKSAGRLLMVEINHERADAFEEMIEEIDQLMVEESVS